MNTDDGRILDTCVAFGLLVMPRPQAAAYDDINTYRPIRRKSNSATVLIADYRRFRNYAAIPWAALNVLCNAAFVSPYVEKKRRFLYRQLGPLRGSSSPFQHFESARVKPN